MKQKQLTTADLIKGTPATYPQINWLVLSGKLEVAEKIAGRRLFDSSAIQSVNDWLTKQEERKSQAKMKAGEVKSEVNTLANNNRGINTSQVQCVIDKPDDTQRDAEVLSSKDREETHPSERHGCSDPRVSKEANSTAAPDTAGHGKCRQGEGG